VKKLFKLTLFLVLVLIPATIYAAIFELIPSSSTVEVGDVVSVGVWVEPQGVNLYTVGIELSYPTNIGYISSFSFLDEWITLRQSGYDQIDNSAGKLIKTAGYTGGFSTNKKLGTVFIKAVSEGDLTLSVGGGSMLLDADGENVASGGEKVSIKINKVQAKAPKKVVAPAPVVPEKGEVQDKKFDTAELQEVTEAHQPTKVEYYLNKFLPQTQLALLVAIIAILEYKILLYSVLGLTVFLVLMIIFRRRR
jgi:hypothetical protein